MNLNYSKASATPFKKGVVHHPGGQLLIVKCLWSWWHQQQGRKSVDVSAFFSEENLRFDVATNPADSNWRGGHHKSGPFTRAFYMTNKPMPYPNGSSLLSRKRISHYTDVY